MTETVFVILGWLLLLSGLVIAWRFGWRDPGKGSRRCPKCWYDMAANAGRQCPECGNESVDERLLFKAHRRWRFIAAGCFLVLVSYPVFKWPLYQKDGSIGFVPRVVTFAFLPEISEQIKQRLPRTSPRDVELAQKLAKTSPLWIWERALLANSFARMVRDKARVSYGKIVILRESPMLGEQISIALPALSNFIENDELGFDVWTSMSTFAFSPAYRHLVPAVTQAMCRHPQRIASRAGNIDLLRSWGATDDEMHDVLSAAIACDSEAASNLAADYLWRSGLTKPADIPVLLKRLANPKEWEAHYAANCLADVGMNSTEFLEQARAELHSTFPNRVMNACVILVAMGPRAEPALADFDAISTDGSDNLLRDVASFAAASIRGRPARAARPFSLASRVIGPQGQNYCHQITSLLYHSSLTAEEKARQLTEIVELGRGQMTRYSAPVSMEYAIVFLGRLGPAARTSVPNLVTLCGPGTPGSVRESAIDSILQIGLVSEKDASDLLKSLPTKVPTQQKSIPVTDPAMIWRIERLQAMATECVAR